MSYGKEPTDLNLKKAVYPYFVLKNKSLRNELIKMIAVKIIMLVLLLVTPCAPRLTVPPPRPEDGERMSLRKCAPDNQM